MTGTLDPDVTGDYEPIGPYNGKPSYELAGGGWFLWWDLAGVWGITDEIGVGFGAWWIRIDPAIEGEYAAQGTATGVATVTEI